VAHLLEGDFDSAAEMLADNLVYGHSTGLVDDKQSLLASYRQGTVQYRAIDSRIAKAVRVTDDVVLTHGTIAIRAVVNGAEGRFGGQYMAVWRRENERWLLQALQASSAVTK
jgi:hypothetical protein